MARRATCPQGHQWDLTEQETSTIVSCPVCGQATRILPGDGRTPTDTTAPDERTAPSASPTTSAWPTLEGYEILEELGQGGMGVVYKARQLSLQRIVAIKVMGASTTASAERFKIEAEAVAHLQHANIVQIYEVGEQEGRSFLALEFIDGGTLSRKLTAGALEPNDAARLVETLARALHHAHERGILHRDIKPGNVLLTSEGMPKITDFGLAKRLEGPGVTQTGHGILGTPSYMAPEQAEGKSKKLGPAVDVYALGATLYEALTGRPPFREDTPLETMMKVTREEPISLSQLCPNAPRDLQTICHKCLQKSPALRYPTALALADDLRRFIEGESIHARPPTAWERAVRWTRRNREMIAVTAGALAVLVLLVIVLWPAPSRPKTDNRVVPPPAAPLDLPADLALIPRDGAGFVTLKLADILAREGLLELYTAIAKKMTIAPAPAFLGKLVEREFGVRPIDMARLTILVPDTAAQARKTKQPEPGTGLIRGDILDNDFAGLVTTSQPYDRAKVQNLYPGGQVKRHRDKDYLFWPDPAAPAICFVADNILAVAKDEAKIKEFVERMPSPNAPAPLADALRLAKTHPFVLGFRPSAELRKQWSQLKGAPSKDAAEAIVDAIRELQIATLTLDWDLRTSGGDVLHLNGYLLFADEATAKIAGENLEIVRKEALENFKKIQAALLERKETASITEITTIFLKEAALAIRRTRQEVQGKSVQLNMQMRMDIAELFGSLGEATAQVRKAAARAETLRNLKQVGEALLGYQEVHGRLPAASTVSKAGQPLLSWRVEILPHLGEKKLYDEFKRDEPWDSPHNKKLLAKMPSVYAQVRDTGMLSFGSIEVPIAQGGSWLASLGSAGLALLPGQSRLAWGAGLMPLANPFLRSDPYVTSLQAPVGPGCAFEGKERVATPTFSDGSSNTILLIEAGDQVPWTKPADLVIDPKRSLPRLGNAGEEGICVLLADGSTRTISRHTPERDLRALLSRNGGEKIDMNKLP